MKKLNTYIGIEPFTVKVDDSPRLQELVKKAKEYRSLPFSEKLKAVKELTIDSLINAYEQMVVNKVKADNSKLDFSEYKKAKTQYEKFGNIVFGQHPLSYALEQKTGCCRYQGALFFVLGYEADLGDKNFISGAPVNDKMGTVFNELVNEGKYQIVSIFTESLKDKSFDYSKQNPNLFKQIFQEIPGMNMYSYHRTKEGLVIAENPERHIKELKE